MRSGMTVAPGTAVLMNVALKVKGEAKSPRIVRSPEALVVLMRPRLSKQFSEYLCLRNAVN